MNNLSISGILWVSVVAGIIATLGMELLLRKITRSGLDNADMVRAIGSIFTKSLWGAHLFYGLLVGIVVGFIQ